MDDSESVEMKRMVGEPVLTQVEEEDEDEEDNDRCSALDDPGFKTSKLTTNRQISAPRSKWNLVKKSVDDRIQARRDTDRWMNVLTRSMSHGVSEFFGVNEDASADRVKDKWRARSRRLHHNKLIGGRKDDTEDSDGSHVMSSRGSLYLGASQDQFESIGSPPIRWNRKTARPFDPLSSMHSRQFSRISTASSSRRALRAQQSHHKTRRESVFKMAFDGVKNLALNVTGVEKKTLVRSRSFAPTKAHQIGLHEDFSLDDVFFDTPAPTSAAIQMRPFFSPGATSGLPYIHEKSESEPPEVTTPMSDEVCHSLDSAGGLSGAAWMQQQEALLSAHDVSAPAVLRDKEQEEEAPSKMFDGMKRIKDKFINLTLVNSDRRQYGVGVVGVWLDRDYRKSRIDSHVRQQMEELDDYRPYFTYWVTFVQVVIFIFTVIVYSFASVGFENERVQGMVLKTSRVKETCIYEEPQNMWIGPRQNDLIHLGAKYSPCMRNDANVESELKTARDNERKTSCCIMDDGDGCFQASEQECSGTFTTFHKVNSSETVCRLDPAFCPELKNYRDRADWPKCSEPNVTILNLKSNKDYRHMKCDILGRPCCVGIEGQCIITTPEHCQFLRGYFHEDAFLCSQVPCLSEVCGMLPFKDKNNPDQFYRLFTSLFLHAGLIQLLITCCIQMIVMRDLEKLAGWVRMLIIYITSGIAGSLASAIFLPYHVEAGPTGSQFGILACLFVEVIQSWQMLKSPISAIGKLAVLMLFLFIVGLFPWIDNYAHLVGFVFGFLLSFGMFPHVTFNVVDERGKKIGIVVCLVVAVCLFLALVVMFYVVPIYECDHCKYFNCIPLTDSFCNKLEIKIDVKNYQC